MLAAKLALAAWLLAALPVAGAACGHEDGRRAGGKVSGSRLTIYSSLPLQGSLRTQARAVLDGEKLALEQAGAKAGDYKVDFVSLDDSTPAAGGWEPGQTSANARRAAQDPKTIAYLGELNSGASAISIPILNQAGILQISPASTHEGLTRSTLEPGEPKKYYPTGQRTFGRVVPPDSVQATAQVSWMKEKGVKTLYVVNDRQVYGKGIAGQVARSAAAQGIQVVGNEAIDPKAASYRSLATKIQSAGAEAMFFGGIADGDATRLWKDVYAASPAIKLFGPDGVATEAFAARLGPAGKSTFLTAPTLDPKLYPPAAKRFFKAYEKAHGSAMPSPAIYGYAAMNAALEAIDNAGDEGNDRAAVIDGFFAIDNTQSALGTYSIDSNGDTSITEYGAYTVKGGALVFAKVLEGKKT